MNELAPERGPSVSPEVTRRIARLSALLDDPVDVARRKEAADRLRVYHGDARWLVQRWPREPKEIFQIRPKPTPNIVKHALKSLSFLYNQPPSRTADAADRWTELLWEWGDAGLNTDLGGILPLAKLCGQVQMLARWQPSPYEPVRLEDLFLSQLPPAEEPGIQIVTWTPDDCLAIPHLADARHAEAVALRVGTVNAVSTINPASGLPQRGPAELWWYFDEETFCLLELARFANVHRQFSIRPMLTRTNEAILTTPHNYGQMPVRPLRAEYAIPGSGYWGAPWGGKDLLDNVRDIYQTGSEYQFVAMLQRGQPVGRKVKSFPLGPYYLLELGDDPNSSFTIVGNAANLEGMRAGHLTGLEEWSKSSGMPSRVFNLDRDASAMSGIAIMLDRAELEDERLSDEKAWRYNESVIHRAAAAACRSVGIEAPDPKVTVAYTPPALPMTHEERLAMVLAETGQLKTMGRREAKATLHPDLTVGQVDDLLAEAEDEETDRGAANADREAQDHARALELQRAQTPFGGLLSMQPATEMPPASAPEQT